MTNNITLQSAGCTPNRARETKIKDNIENIFSFINILSDTTNIMSEPRYIGGHDDEIEEIQHLLLRGRLLRF